MPEQQPERLSPEREQEIRARLRRWDFFTDDDARDLLAELDARTVELAAHKTNEGFVLRAHRAEQDLAAAYERVRTLEDHIHQVRLAWNRVGRCEDEFLPEQPGACSEVRDLFDAAVSALLLHAEGIRPLPQAIESEVKS